MLPALVVAGVLLAVAWAWDRSGGGVAAGADGVTGSAAGGPGYAFLSISPGTGHPVTFDACRPIGYVVNPDNAPSDWEDLIVSAADRVAEASGFVLSYQGTTDERVRRAREDRPVLITWEYAEDVPRLARAAAFAGPTYVSDGGGRVRSDSGRMVLDADDLDRSWLFGASTTWREAVVMHEFAHVLGLAHTTNPDQLMFEGSNDVTDLADGDRAGLRRLAAVPCG